MRSDGGVGRTAALFAIVSMTAFAQPAADSQVFAALLRADPTLGNPQVLYRHPVSDTLDLVIAWANPKDPQDIAQMPKPAKIGLFLQDRAYPARIHTLSIAAGGCRDNCSPRVERATGIDTAISWHEEKGGWRLNQKFVYDIAKKVVTNQNSYAPIVVSGVVAAQRGAIFLAASSGSPIAIEYNPGVEPEFRILSAIEALPWKRLAKTPAAPRNPFGPKSAFRLREIQTPVGTEFVVEESRGERFIRHSMPASTYATFADARPSRVKDGYSAQATRLSETIGPTKTLGSQLWFGKTFYDSEGASGVGGFGYFNTTERKYHVFAPPEMADWSVSAMDVGPETIWLGLVHRGEWGDSGGGLLRYDRLAGTARRIELPEEDIVKEFGHAGDRVLAPTGFGIAVIANDQVHRYFVERTADGRLRVVEAIR